MNDVFLDTVGLLALWDKSDQWHAAAASAFESIQNERPPVCTTTFVLAECGNAAARRPYRLAVERLREQLEASSSLVIPTVDDWSVAWDAYRRGEAGSAGIVDHLSISVMNRLGIRRVFSCDRHFESAGLELLF